MPYSLATGRYSGTQGISTATSATTLSDSTQVWGTNVYTGKTVQSFSAGFPTRGIITSNTTTVLTLSAGWDAGTPTSGQPYILSDLQPNIGSLYHVGFSNGTQFYGYMLEPSVARDGGFRERSDISAKQQLIQYSSPNIIDRDFVYWPRVSQGDFSGGGFQPVFIDPKRYWDSDLDVSLPGYVTLYPLEHQIAQTHASATGAGPQIIRIGTVALATYKEANGRIYKLSGGTSSTLTPGVQALSMDTDGRFAYIASTTAIDQLDNTGAFVAHVATAVNGTLGEIWAIDQGTNGYFLYYKDTTTSSNKLYKIDLTAAFPVAAGSQPQVPTGSNPIEIVDLVAYQNGIAILTLDGGTTQSPAFGSSTGTTLWFHDGVNMTPIARWEGYTGRGLCNGMGNLYVGLDPTSNSRLGSLLARVTTGSVDVVLDTTIPSSTIGTVPQSGQPRVGGRYVFWNGLGTSLGGIQDSSSRIWAYDMVTGASYQLPGDINNPPLGLNGVRWLSATASGVAYVTGGINTPWIVFDRDTNLLGGIVASWQATGRLITSRIDFGTPGIEKRFRRLEAIHSGLGTGVSLKIDAYIDQDPATLGVGGTINATVTNSKLASVATDFFMGNLIGHSAYFVFTISSPNNASTPTLNWYSVEISTPAAWEFTLVASNKVVLLDGQQDDQGTTPSDLVNFWRDAWQNPRRLTLFSSDGFAYTVALESYDIWTPSPKPQITESTVGRQQESFIHVVLRQTLADN